MKRSTADRSFAALASIALVPYALLGLFGCGFLTLVGYQLLTDGWAGLTEGGRDLRPAVGFFALVTATTAIAVRSIARQAIATRQLAAAVATRAIEPPDGVLDIAATARVRRRLIVVDDPAAFSFTFGLRHLRVVISTGLIASATPAQLEAVLRHERYHVRKHDTTKLVIARAARSALFFLPAIGQLGHRYVAGRELAADRAAIRTVGPAALTGALLAAAGGPTWTDLSVAAALDGGSFEQRVSQLETGHEPPMDKISRSALWATAIGLAGLAAAFILAVAAAGPEALSMDQTLPTGPAGPAVALAATAACTIGMVGGPALLLRRRRSR